MGKQMGVHTATCFVDTF